MTSLVVAPVFYLLPFGVGLLFLRGLIGRAPASLLFPIATLLGMIVVTRSFQAAENGNVLSGHLTIITGISLVAALIGLTGLARWRPRFKVHVSTGLIAITAIIPAFVYNFFILSRFPITDLFQEVHTMKGAEELARFGVLNPLVADSYIPVKQVINGILIKAFGYDQLVGYWALAVWNACFKLLVLWAVSRRAGNGQQRALAFVLMSGFIVATDVTNGTLCALAALLLFVTLVDGVKLMGRYEENWKSLVFLLSFVGGTSFLWIAFSASSILYLFFLTVAVLAASVLSLGRLELVVNHVSAGGWKFNLSRLVINNRFLLAFVLIGLMIPLHRGSLLFIPLAAFLACFWTIQTQAKVSSLVARIGRLLPAVALCLALLSTAEYLHMVSISGAINSLMTAMATRLLDLRGPSEISLGLGGLNATLEWARSIGLLGVSAMGLVWAYLITTKSGKQLQADRDFVLPWTAAWILTCFILTGFPYAYRSVFFVCVLFAFAMSVALPKLWSSIGEPRWLLVILLPVVGIGYELTALAFPAVRPYRSFFDPFVIGIFTVAAFFLATMQLGRRRRPLWLGTLIVFALVADRVGARAAFFGHTYGMPPDHAEVVGHYTLEELELANGLRGEDPGTILVSDPYTISLVRARTGLSSLTQYSNLDTLESRNEQLLRETLSYAEQGNAWGVCKNINEVLGGGGEYSYLRKRLNLKGSSVNVILIYSSRTDRWQDLAPGGHVGYFPTESPLRPSLISTLSSLGSVEKTSTDRLLVVHLGCGYPDVPQE